MTSGSTILYVDDDELLGRAISQSLTRHLGLAVHWHQDPVSPAGYDLAIIDWNPYGPEMVYRCQCIGVPYFVYSGDPGAARSCGHRAVSKDDMDGLRATILEMLGDNLLARGGK